MASRLLTGGVMRCLHGAILMLASLALCGEAAAAQATTGRTPVEQAPVEQAPADKAPAERPSGAAKLIDCIEAPYAYVGLDSLPPVADGEPAKGGSVQRLLGDPALDVLFGARPGATGDGSMRAMALVRGLLRRGAGEVELAMTGIVPAVGQPLIVLRVRLLRGEAARLESGFTDASAVASPYRTVGERQTYRLQGDRGDGPGQVIELAVVGDDLIVGNDGTAIREVLAPTAGPTSAAPARRVLSADPQFQALHRRLELPRGSLLLYADWQRLGRRLRALEHGAAAQLLGSSGLGSANALMMSLAPAGEDAADESFSATLLLDFDAAAADAVRDPARHRRQDGHSRAGRRPRSGVGIDGWFAATEPVKARALLRELPRGGLGGLVLSVDLSEVAAWSPRSSHMVWALREAFTQFGLDFDRNVLARLGARGTVQLHFGPPSPGGDADTTVFADVAPVYALRAASRRAAQDLFGDLRRVVETTGLGQLVEIKDQKGKRQLDVLELRGRKRAFSAVLAVHNDSLLLTYDASTMAQVHDELRRGGRASTRRSQFAEASIQSIAGDDVAGLFDLDLEPVFARVTAALAGVDLSALPKRHVGYLDIDRRASGAVVRIRVLSSR